LHRRVRKLFTRRLPSTRNRPKSKKRV
jgi:hypothetical protein